MLYYYYVWVSSIVVKLYVVNFFCFTRRVDRIIKIYCHTHRHCNNYWRVNLSNGLGHVREKYYSCTSSTLSQWLKIGVNNICRWFATSINFRNFKLYPFSQRSEYSTRGMWEVAYWCFASILHRYYCNLRHLR